MKTSTCPPSKARPPTVTVPLVRPYLMALSTRLPSTCSRRSGSARTARSGAWLTSVTLLAAARPLKSSRTLATTGARATGCRFELDAAGFQFGDGEQVFDEQPEALGVAVNGLQEPGGDFGVVPGAVEQRFDVALDERQRGAEFMADVGDEFLAGVFKLLEAGQIVEDQHGAVALGPRR